MPQPHQLGVGQMLPHDYNLVTSPAVRRRHLYITVSILLHYPKLTSLKL